MRLARGTAMSLTRTLALSLLVGLVAPAAARADGLFVPFIGVNFGGNSGRALSAAIDAERLDWGMSLAYMGGGVLGTRGGSRETVLTSTARPISAAAAS
jgi:hypothetical protein